LLNLRLQNQNHGLSLNIHAIEKKEKGKELWTLFEDDR
jgi:hypothetical protein